MFKLHVRKKSITPAPRLTYRLHVRSSARMVGHQGDRTETEDIGPLTELHDKLKMLQTSEPGVVKLAVDHINPDFGWDWYTDIVPSSCNARFEEASSTPRVASMSSSWSSKV